jgi:hypothetical protein
MHYRNGVYLIDSAEGAVPGLASKNILTWMVGKHVFIASPFPLDDS